MSTKKQTKVMDEEVAKNEFYSFIQKWVRKPGTIDEVCDEFEECIESLMSGNLVIDNEGIPSYTLEDPVKNDSNDVVYDVIKFKTRVKPNTQANLMKGIDIQKDAATYSLVMIAHITGVTTRLELDLFGRHDYNVMRKMATVFM